MVSVRTKSCCAGVTEEFSRSADRSRSFRIVRSGHGFCWLCGDVELMGGSWLGRRSRNRDWLGAIGEDLVRGKKLRRVRLRCG